MTAGPPEREWGLRYGGALALIATMLVVGWFMAPGTISTKDHGRVIVCPFRNLTGLPCPGCGMSRAFHHMVHGRIVEAVKMNALVPVVFLAVLVEMVNAIVAIARGGRPIMDWTRIFDRPFMRVAAYTFIVAALAYDLARIVLIIRSAHPTSSAFDDALIMRLLR